MTLLVEEIDEISALSNYLMNVPLDLQSVEVEHRLDCVHILRQHSYHICIYSITTFKVIRIDESLLQLAPSRIDHISLQIGP